MSSAAATFEAFPQGLCLVMRETLNDCPCKRSGVWRLAAEQAGASQCSTVQVVFARSEVAAASVAAEVSIPSAGHLRFSAASSKGARAECNEDARLRRRSQNKSQWSRSQAAFVSRKED